MDRWSRNQRLYETLKGMGLYVSPIPEPTDPTKIREMVVAADLPFQSVAEDAAERGVLLAVKGSQVGDVVQSAKHPQSSEGGCQAAERDGGNVVDFPAKR